MKLLNWLTLTFILLFTMACWMELHSIRVFIGAPECCHAEDKS